MCPVPIVLHPQPRHKTFFLHARPPGVATIDEFHEKEQDEEGQESGPPASLQQAYVVALEPIHS